MKQIPVSLSELYNRRLPLGRVGENVHVQIVFQCNAIFSEFPNASTTLIVTAPGGESYAPEIVKSGTNILWTITDSDLAKDGGGEVQLTFKNGNEKIKSYIGKTQIFRSLAENGQIPTPVENWIERADNKLSEVDEAIEGLNDIDATASGLETGAAPTVSVTEVDGHKRLNFGIPKGDKGDKGDTGSRGPKGDKGDPPTATEISEATEVWLSGHITNPSSPPLDASLTLPTAAAPADKVGELKSAIVTVGNFVNYNIFENDWDGNYVVSISGVKTQSDSYRTSKPIFLKLGETIKVSSALYSSSQCQIFRVTSDGTFIDASVVTSGGNVVETNTYTCRIDGGAYYAYSGRIETAPITAEKYLRKIDVAYIAPDGSNNNAGTYESPFATVNFALALGARKIIVKPGQYFQTIDLNNAVEKNIEICASTKNLISEFKNPNSLIGASETKVSGYTKVYSMPCNKTISSGNIWLFQDGATTPETLISADERLPIQRGQRNRVDSAGRIIKCSANNLSDALTEIDTSESDVYKWYLDGTTLYFSRRETVSASLSIRYSDGANFITNGTRDISLSLTGLSIKYMTLDIDETTNTKVNDCRVGCVYGDGAVTYDGAINALFTRVEAFMCFNGVNGDGFNAHGVNSGNSFAKQTTATLIDCWSHDNNDDGFSDHERCESTIIGGLFEYNGKAGVTPSYGSHCNCYNVYSRKNWSGFFCTGAPESAENGIGTQLYCIGCIAENNGIAGNQKSGFVVNGTGNILIAENCKSIGQFVGYNALPNAFIRLRDCTAKDNDYNLNREGTIVVDNTTLVT